jgi:hypothetical protein
MAAEILNQRIVLAFFLDLYFYKKSCFEYLILADGNGILFCEHGRT